MTTTTPDVGGDVTFSLIGLTNYCVVWQRDVSASNTDILARIVQHDGVFSGSVIELVDSPGTIDRPAVTAGLQPSAAEWCSHSGR